jgi:hypothetical protein
VIFKKFTRTGWLFCCVLLALLSSLVSAQQAITAKVLASEGQVEILRETSRKLQVQSIAFKVADELIAGDTIITGKNGRLVLGLADGSQAVIAPKTTVILRDLSETPRTLFQMIKGKTRVQIEKLGGQPNPYRVNTPTAVIAVRGTIFDILADEDETQVYLHEGAVEVFNLRLLDQPLLLRAGQMTRVNAARLPRLPNTFKVGRNDDLFRLSQPRNLPGNGRIAERGSPPNTANTGRGSGAPNQTGQADGGRGNPRGTGGTGNPGGSGGMEGAQPAPRGSGRRPN